jgi:FAD/FMN-containing dehydrogenase
MSIAAEVDARALARKLSQALRGEVRFSPGSRALYANDSSVHRQLPLGVVMPRDASDVITAVDICRAHGAPIGARGCGTGLAARPLTRR